MPILATVAWSWITSIGGGILSKVPWQVWAAIGGLILVMYYGHVREKRGYMRCTAQVQKATDAEMRRRTEAANQSAQEAQQLAMDSTERARTLKGELDATQAEMRRLQDELKTKGGKPTACIPQSITDRWQRTRGVRGR
jgi:uncharacterized protein HemX